MITEYRGYTIEQFPDPANRNRNICLYRVGRGFARHANDLADAKTAIDKLYETSIIGVPHTPAP